MSACRFSYQNLLDDPSQITPSSFQPGLVGMPVAKAQGSAVAYTAGQHTGGQDRLFLVEIDSVAQGSGVGQATFRWRRADAPAWEAAGLPTSSRLQDLADGVRIKWTSGVGDNFLLGDGWSILASGGQGVAMLLDGDRDTCWCSLGCLQEHLTLDLGQERAVEALVLADHNLGPQGRARLLASSQPQAWETPELSLELPLTQPHLCAFLTASFRHWRLVLEDPGNPEGLLRAGILYLGESFQPSRMFASRYARSLVAGRSTTTTDAGKVSGSARGLAESWSISFRGLSQADVRTFAAMYQAIHDPQTGRLSPLFFTPFVEDPGGTLYCLPGASLDPVYQHQDSYALDLTLEEVVRTHV